jgi:hypothetical protein
MSELMCNDGSYNNIKREVVGRNAYETMHRGHQNVKVTRTGSAEPTGETRNAFTLFALATESLGHEL